MVDGRKATCAKMHQCNQSKIKATRDGLDADEKDMAGKDTNGGKDMAGDKRYNLKIFWREKMICGGKGKDMAGKDIEGTESVIDGQTCGTRSRR